MHTLYSLLMRLVQTVLPLAGNFNKKLQKSITGRKDTIKILNAELITGKKTLWMHAASLGEYEQGVPILKALTEHYPDHH